MTISSDVSMNVFEVEGEIIPLVDWTADASEEVFNDDDVEVEVEGEGDEVTSLFCPWTLKLEDVVKFTGILLDWSIPELEAAVEGPANEFNAAGCKPLGPAWGSYTELVLDWDALLEAETGSAKEGLDWTAELEPAELGPAVLGPAVLGPALLGPAVLTLEAAAPEIGMLGPVLAPVLVPGWDVLVGGLAVDLCLLLLLEDSFFLYSFS